jgi:hypothetical protein
MQRRKGERLKDYIERASESGEDKPISPNSKIRKYLAKAIPDEPLTLNCCWRCGGTFEDVGKAMKIPPGRLGLDAVNRETGLKRCYRFYECRTCGWTMFLRDLK